MASIELPLRPAKTPTKSLNRRTAQFLDLPLTIVRDIIEITVTNSPGLYAILNLRCVNHLFNHEVFKFLARNRLDLIPFDDQFPTSLGFKAKLVREHIGNGDRKISDFQTHVHAIVDDLVALLPNLPSPPVTLREEVIDHVCRAVMKAGYHRKLFGGSWKIPQWQMDYRTGGICRTCYGRASPYTPKPTWRQRKSATKEDVRRSTFVVAVILDWSQVVDFILSQDADFRVESGSRFLGRPLESAMELGSPNSLRLLLERGARLYQDREMPVLLVVAKRGHVEVLKVLRSMESMKKWKSGYENVWTAVICSASHTRQFAVLRWAFDEKILLNQVRDVQFIVLRQALRFGDVEVAKQLIETNDLAVDLSRQKHLLRRTGAYWRQRAITTGDDEMIRFLLGLFPETELGTFL